MLAESSRLKDHFRILTFCVHYQSNTYHIDIPDTNTMRDLKLQIFYNTSVLPDQQELHGWRKEPRGETSTLKSLDLPKENALFMCPVSDVGKSLSQVMKSSEHLANNSILEIRDKKAKNVTYKLDFPGANTILDVKDNIYFLNHIPPRDQLWNGWPLTVKNDSMILAQTGISNPQHKLIVDIMPTKETKKEVVDFDDMDTCVQEPEDKENVENASETFEMDEVVSQPTIKRAYQVQLETMLHHMETHTLFARGQIMKLGVRGHEKFRSMWMELTNDLNEMGPTSKDVKGWQNSWKNLRLSCKKKKAQYLTQWRRTGNVGISAEPLTDFESRVSAIFGKHGDGLSVIPEVGLHRNLASKNYCLKNKQVDQRINYMNPIALEDDGEKEKKKRDRHGKEQLRALMGYIEENLQMIPGVVSPINSHLWNDLTSQLNSIIGGVVREIRAWVNCWKDMKSRVLQRRKLLMKSYDVIASKTPTKNVDLNKFVYSQPRIKSCRLQAAQGVITQQDAKGKANCTITSVSLAAVSAKKSDRKTTNFSGYKYHLGMTDESLSPKPKPPPVVDITDDKSKQPTRSAGTQAAVDIVKEQNTLINDCAKLFIQCFQQQNALLKDGLNRIAESISTSFMASGKSEEKVEVKEEERDVDLSDADTLPFAPEFEADDEALQKVEEEEGGGETEENEDDSEMTLRFDDF